ncbi:MAG: TrkH family potassium uptake protein [Butyricicoccaceae bacterium]
MRVFTWLMKAVGRKNTTGGRIASRIILQGFALVILLGTVLLLLPISTKEGMTTSVLDALFTATSATCVTGLVVVDTYTHWTLFGQFVILCLIQCGGLGFVSMMIIAAFLTHRRISVHERVVLSTAYNTDDLAGTVRLARNVLLTTLSFEVAGAILLSARFVQDFGLKNGIIKGVFTSISAFCNAGFDLMGQKEPGSSLMYYVDDPVVCGVVMALIVVGGIGFVVWSDVQHEVPFVRSRLHTRVAIVVTAGLIIGGTVLIYAFECNNPETLGGLDGRGEKWLAALFQSVTLRTAGFATVDQSSLTAPSVLVSCFLMFIGGSPGSTAGGIKTVTLAVLVMSMLAVMRGKRDVNLMGRRIPSRTVLNASMLAVIGAMLVGVGTLMISIFEPDIGLRAIVYEVISAFGTVGLSQNLTSMLSSASRVVLIILMYLGRVGLLTLAVGVFTRHTIDPKIRYPETRLMIG